MTIDRQRKEQQHGKKWNDEVCWKLTMSVERSRQIERKKERKKERKGEE
jgi:hypothetical protein